MDDPKLREYAQRENDYLLSLLLRPGRQSTVEDPEELAERNCGATARCFGETDPLHAMALNTFAFVLMYKNGDARAALDSAVRASEILRDHEGQEEMLLESKCLRVQAMVEAGSP